MARFVILYKYQKNSDETWGLWEEEVPVLDIAAWEHNGWSRICPTAPPEEPAPARGRKAVEVAG
jgi:hypothetical protein